MVAIPFLKIQTQKAEDEMDVLMDLGQLAKPQDWFVMEYTVPEATNAFQRA